MKFVSLYSWKSSSVHPSIGGTNYYFTLGPCQGANQPLATIAVEEYFQQNHNNFVARIHQIVRVLHIHML